MPLYVCGTTRCPPRARLREAQNAEKGVTLCHHFQVGLERGRIGATLGDQTAQPKRADRKLDFCAFLRPSNPVYHALVTTEPNLYFVFADLVLALHLAIVAFVVLGLPVIWIGFWRNWDFVRNFWFRLAHLAAMGVVLAESVFGVLCPLTIWEERLRLLAGGGRQYAGSFVQHWVHWILFYQADERVFTALYAAFFGAIVLSLFLVRPRGPGTLLR